jgi:methyl-accepting chemotaxis protein
MSTMLLIVLTVVEILALVVVLALFVIALTRRLRSVATALGQLSGGDLRAIQGDVFLIGAGAAILNRQLDTIAGALPAIAEKAESLPSHQAQIPHQSRTEASGAAWQPAVAAQDPMIGPK